jgi:hypothetical protein
VYVLRQNCRAAGWRWDSQNNDPETGEIKQKLIEEKLTTDYFCQNDILFPKINPGRNPPIYRAFVPKRSRLGLLRMFHDEQCHLGPDKTFAKLNHYFWFPGITKFVKKTPVRNKVYYIPSISRRSRFIRFTPTVLDLSLPPIPFHTVHPDCVGPFPESPEGFKHILLIVDAFTKYLFFYSYANIIRTRKL